MPILEQTAGDELPEGVLQNIESIQTASYRMLTMAAVKMTNKKIAELLKENLDEANEDLMLFQQLAANYLK